MLLREHNISEILSGFSFTIIYLVGLSIACPT